MKAALLTCFLLATLATAARADLESEVIAYADGETALEGYIAYDNAIQGPRPGILVVHDWRGHGEFQREKARELAKMGYVAFALDMYGQGTWGETPQEAGALAGPFKKDRALMRRRARVGLEMLRKHPLCDTDRVGAIGFCFGGTVVLELARDRAPVDVVVTFHGGLDTPDPESTTAIDAKVLVCHGGDDPYVPPEQVATFWKEMRDAGAVYEIVIISGAVHSFTEPGAGDDPSTGVAYDARATRISWDAMRRLFETTFETD